MMNKQYPFKIGEWTDEPTEITTIDPVIKNGRVVGVKPGKRTVMQRTHYAELSAPQKITCNALEHEWFIPSPHDHVAHCHNCKKKQLIRAVFERVLNGKIVDRDSLDVIA